MKNSLQRVKDVIEGRAPDRPPLFEMLRNDAVLSHFAGERLTIENRESVVYRAYAPAVDATRPMVGLPLEEEIFERPDGSRVHRRRWTTWVEPPPFKGTENYATVKRAWIERFDPADEMNTRGAPASDLARIAEERRRLGEVFFIPVGPGVRLQALYEEIGLDNFSLCMSDCPDIVDELLECNTMQALAWIERLPLDHGIQAVFLSDDMAFKTAPLFSPRWLRRSHFPRLARITSAYHARGIKVLFHSDGNLNMVLDDLAEAGIDGLNPIEVLAGMDVGEIHRRHPHLFLAGGIDVSRLLPFGKPGEVRDAVRRAVDAAEGRLMVGSSTEIHNDVPLENYLALREAVLEG